MKKDTFYLILIAIVIVILFVFGLYRFNAINDGSIKVVSQTEMAERR